MTTVLISFSPLMISTVLPLSTPPTTWPPVTLANVEFVNSDGTNCIVVVKAVDGSVAFKTWYSRRAATVPISLAAAAPPVVARNLVNASLEGARIVMPLAAERADVSAGCIARRPIKHTLATAHHHLSDGKHILLSVLKVLLFMLNTIDRVIVLVLLAVAASDSGIVSAAAEDMSMPGMLSVVAGDMSIAATNPTRERGRRELKSILTDDGIKKGTRRKIKSEE